MTSNTATFYAHVQATYSRWDHDRVESIKVTKITQMKPELLDKNTVAVKLTLEIPDDAFKPFSPSAVIQVPTNQVQQPVHVITEDTHA